MAFFGKTHKMVKAAGPTGRHNGPTGINLSDEMAGADVVIVDRPAPVNVSLSKPVPSIEHSLWNVAHIAEYRRAADQVGIEPAPLVIEEFRLFLAQHDLPVFALSEVVTYMDELTARDNPSGLGWHWCPLRARDVVQDMRFGRASSKVTTEGGFTGGNRVGPASYFETFFETTASQIDLLAQRQMNQMLAQRNWNPPTTEADAPIILLQSGGRWAITPASDFYDSNRYGRIYSRTIPLHALRKIALIEAEFGAGKVAFMVTDYTTEPHIVVNPDPFLMAVIPNPAIPAGTGRFIIDVWDEPGFGIDKMVG